MYGFPALSLPTFCKHVHMLLKSFPMSDIGQSIALQAFGLHAALVCCCKGVADQVGDVCSQLQRLGATLKTHLE